MDISATDGFRRCFYNIAFLIYSVLLAIFLFLRHRILSGMRKNALQILDCRALMLWALFTEISGQHAFKCCTVAGFVFAHFMNGVMNGIQAECFGFLGDSQLAFASAVFGVYS